MPSEDVLLSSARHPPVALASAGEFGAIRSSAIYGGTSEIMKTIIARDITGLRT